MPMAITAQMRATVLPTTGFRKLQRVTQPINTPRTSPTRKPGPANTLFSIVPSQFRSWFLPLEDPKRVAAPCLGGELRGPLLVGGGDAPLQRVAVPPSDTVHPLPFPHRA